jgi:hypothetical protein
LWYLLRLPVHDLPFIAENRSHFQQPNSHERRSSTSDEIENEDELQVEGAHLKGSRLPPQRSNEPYYELLRQQRMEVVKKIR